jgi:hypothetical protein
VTGEIGSDALAEILQLVVRATPQKRTPAAGRAERPKRTRAGGGGGKPKKRSASPKTLGTLDLRPNGGTTFEDFVAEKKPQTHEQKQIVIIYWLEKVASVSSITVDHINTCYQAVRWPRPKDLNNSLRTLASKKGWIDTSDMSNITIEVLGENEVNHKLPKPPKP